MALRTGRLGAHITDGGFRKQPAEVRSLALAGKGAERGSSGEHAMKIIGRGVAGQAVGKGLSSTHGAAAARSCSIQRRGARKCILSRLGAGRARVIVNIVARSIMEQ